MCLTVCLQIFRHSQFKLYPICISIFHLLICSFLLFHCQRWSCSGVSGRGMEDCGRRGGQSKNTKIRAVDGATLLLLVGQPASNAMNVHYCWPMLHILTHAISAPTVLHISAEYCTYFYLPNTVRTWGNIYDTIFTSLLVCAP